MNADERHCKKCFYHFRWGNSHGEPRIGCEFILVTGKQRGCDFGRRCTRFVDANPKLRWGIEKELLPGEVPGIAAREKRKERQLHSPRKAIDQNAVNKLKYGRSWAEIAEKTGFSEASWKHIKSKGCCSTLMAEAAAREYGIDILAK